MIDGMRRPPFHRGGQSAGFRESKKFGPFRLWVTKYTNWTNYYGSTFAHCQFWIGQWVEFMVGYDHYRWPEFHRDRRVQIKWTFPILRWVSGTITHEWEMKPPLERRFIELLERGDPDPLDEIQTVDPYVRRFFLDCE